MYQTTAATRNHHKNEALEADTFEAFDDHVIVRRTPDGTFVNHLYVHAYKAATACVTYSPKYGRITISLAHPIKGVHCGDIMKALCGGGGQATIAGSPHGSHPQTEETFYKAVAAVNAAINAAMNAKSAVHISWVRTAYTDFSGYVETKSPGIIKDLHDMFPGIGKAFTDVGTKPMRYFLNGECALVVAYRASKTLYIEVR